MYVREGRIRKRISLSGCIFFLPVHPCSPLGTTVFSLQDGTGTGVLQAEKRLIATGGEPFGLSIGLVLSKRKKIRRVHIWFLLPIKIEKEPAGE